MNMKKKRTPLKVEFKQFQRLPDWPVIMQLTDKGRSLEDASAPKVDMAALLSQENRFAIRSLAE
jgi:hypothetical protein